MSPVWMTCLSLYRVACCYSAFSIAGTINASITSYPAPLGCTVSGVYFVSIPPLSGASNAVK